MSLTTRLRNLSNPELLSQTRDKASEERRITTEFLWHIHEVNRRRLFAKEGYPSLFAYLTEALHYSQGAAGRRISAMRLLSELPETEQALKDGNLSLSVVSTTQNFFRREEREGRKSYTPEEKRELLKSLSGSSQEQCERRLAEISPQAVLRERERPLYNGQTEIRFTASEELMKKLERVRECLAHQNPHFTYSELIEKMADQMLRQIDPLERAKRLGAKRKKTNEIKENQNEIEMALSPSPSRIASSIPDSSYAKPELSQSVTSKLERSASTPLPEKKTFAQVPKPASTITHEIKRRIPARNLREVWIRDQGTCTFIHLKTGKRCNSRFGLEPDHIKPLAQGGDHHTSNLRLRCKAHNQWEAIQSFGTEHMSLFIPGLI